MSFLLLPEVTVFGQNFRAGEKHNAVSLSWRHTVLVTCGSLDVDTLKHNLQSFVL